MQQTRCIPVPKLPQVGPLRFDLEARVVSNPTMPSVQFGSVVRSDCVWAISPDRQRRQHWASK